MPSQTTTRTRLSDLGPAGPRHVRARFDAAQTTDNNRRHWAAADGLSADAAADPLVRQTLRNRCRYEAANNPFARAMKSRIASICVGTGPSLQMLTDDSEVNAKIEAAWREWSRQINLAEKLRAMRAARVDTGEAFLVLGNNPHLTSDVKLDVRLLEADHVASPTLSTEPTPNEADGIYYDAWGNPTQYAVLRHHPGSLNGYGLADEYDLLPASMVRHYFRPERPGQRRGLPEMTASLPVFAELRRYRKAVIGAAETAAYFAIAIHTDAPANEEDAQALEPMDTVSLETRLGTVLPMGWKASQLKPEHPTTTFAEFCRSLLMEAAASMDLPLMVALMDAAEANMASSYVVEQQLARSVAIDRQVIDRDLDAILDAFLTEFAFVRRLLGDRLPESFKHVWFWPPAVHHADPNKVANSWNTKLAAGLASHPQYYAEQGLDWEAEQAAAARAIGVSLDEYRALLRQKLFGAPPPQTPPATQKQQGTDNQPPRQSR